MRAGTAQDVAQDRVQDPAVTVDVAVVGAGPAGTLLAAHLLRTARAQGRRGSVLLVDPRGEDCGGAAFSTPDPRHLLNVRVRDLDALDGERGHFLRWARRHVGWDVSPHDFLPRRVYGAYLRDTLRAAATDLPPELGLLRRQSSVTAVAPTPSGPVRLELDDGAAVLARRVVLARGPAAAPLSWVPSGLAEHPAFVPDPWADGALQRVPAACDVLLVGSGLTAVDVAVSLGRPGRVVHVVSRHGVLPRAHREVPVVADPLPVAQLPVGDAPGLQRWVADQLRDGVRRYGDWRAALDAMRPLTAATWRASGAPAQRELLRSAWAWNVLRHRCSPATARQVGRLRADGAVTVAAATVTGWRSDGSQVVVELSDGSSRRVGAVVACTGPDADVRTTVDPVLRGLLDDGWAVPGPHALGLGTDETGRLRAASGAAAPVWTLGALRRGELWETTAVPEIREQAAALAEVLAPALPAERRQLTASGGRVPAGPAARRPVDLLGLPLTTTAEAAAAYEEGLGRVLRVQSGADQALARAVELDPGFAVAHAALALLGHEAGAAVDVRAELGAARTHAHRCDERERSLVHTVHVRVTGTPAEGARAVRAHLAAHPRDALVLGAAVPTIAFSGVTDMPQEAWELVEAVRPAYGDDWWYAGMLAFVRQEQGRYDEAHELAGAALAVEPSSGHAVHAQTHVYYETGQHRAGLQWLDGWIRECGRSSTHRAHFSWHAALHELSLGDVDAVRRRYDRELAPPHVSGVRALVDSASLLWRCRVTSSWPDELPLSTVLRDVGPELLERPSTPFTAMHAALALTAARDVVGLARLRRHAAASSDHVMSDLVVTLCDALDAVVEERWCDAVRSLRVLGPWLGRFGGSAAQREIIEDTLLDALVRAGRCDEARTLLAERLDRRQSALDRRRLAELPG